MKLIPHTPEFEVVLPHAYWQAALRPLTRDPSLVATGRLRRDVRRVPTGLLAEQLAVHSPPVTGRSFAPLSEWIAIAMPQGDPPEDPGDWLKRLAPLHGQLLVVLLVGFGDNRADWRGWSVERGVVRPLAGFHIVGPEMLHVAAAADAAVVDSNPTPVDAARWSRTLHAVGEDAFRRLRQSSAVIIGCSRTGTLAASMLTALGIGRLGLIDGDTIESHNLDGMLLATEADLGANKAMTVARQLADRRSDLTVRVSRHAFGSRADEPVVGDVDLVVTCVDRAAPRLRVARDIASKRLAPHLDIGTGVTRVGQGERELAADVRLLLPKAGCVRCVGGVGDLEEAEYELRSPPGALPRRRPEAWDARGRLGSLVTLNAMAVATGIQSWLDLLAGQLTASIWHRIRWQAGTWEVHSGHVAADEHCPYCGTTQSRGSLRDPTLGASSDPRATSQ